jgi:tight adherence protein B
VNGWVVAFLVGGVVVVAWPIGLARRRWVTRETPAQRPLPTGSVLLPTSPELRTVATSHPGRSTHPGRSIVVGAVIGGAAGLIAGGPVAALALAAYAGLAARTVLRRWANSDRRAARSRALDEIGAMAADLRAGLPAALSPTAPSSATAPSVTTAPSPAAAPSTAAASEELRLRTLTVAAGRLAERTGAPVADLVDRIEADARADDRARASVAAQAAGARATAMLLAGLPAGGIALGYAIGTDPLQVLLHTPLGAACVAGSLVLQLAGLAWADRLAGAGARR